jgi:hypothetical protein
MEVVKDKVAMDHHRPWALPVSPWNCLIVRFGMIGQEPRDGMIVNVRLISDILGHSPSAAALAGASGSG